MKDGIYIEEYSEIPKCTVHYKKGIIFHIKYPDGKRVWYNEKKLLHRLDGPAIVYINGDKEYYKDGDYHRLDGPAIQWGKYQEWWLNGKYIPVNSQEEYKRYLNTIAFR